MLSSNNRNEYLRKQEPKKQRFAIKKLTVGVASVLIGFTFMGMNVAAHADTTTQQPAAAGETSNTNVSTQESTNNSNSEQQPVTAPKDGAKNQTAPTQKLNLSQSQTANASASALNTSLAEQPVTTPAQNPETVSDWKGFVSALENSNVDEINLNGDITVNGKQGNLAGQALGYNGCLTLNDKNIARKVVINGNGKTLDFGHYSLMFENNNQKNGSTWDITFNNINMKGVSKDNAGTTSTTEAGTFGLISFADVSADNQKKDVVTFKNVTADVTGRPVISGAHNNIAAGLTQKHDETYTLNFTGTNTITDAGATSYPSGRQDSGNTVEAGYINFLKGSNTTINMTQTSSGGQNYGGNAVRAVQDGDATKPAVNIENGANVTINGGKDVRGIYAGRDKLAGNIDGLVNVDGNLTENLGAGHSTAINTGNLTVGATGRIDITTAQDNNQGLVGNLTFNGNHYGVIALGPGHINSTESSPKNTLTDNGSITIKRTATGKLSAPLIAFGGGGVTGNYELTVNQGATLDLQDAAKQQSSDHAGMITMFGTSSNDVFNFNNPGYVNLQRVGQGVGSNQTGITGNFLQLQGNGTNQANITGTIPVSQWDEGNVSETPSFVWSINDLKSFNDWGTNAYHFIGGKDKLINTSRGTVIMGANQAGKDSFKFDDGTNVPGNPTYTTNSGSYAPYLNQFLNNFSWWKPQRLSFGSRVPYANDADKYEPEVQTITGTTSQTLNDLDAKNGIKDLIQQDDTTIPLPSDATVTWYNSATDKAAWDKKMLGNNGSAMPEPTNPTGNLKTTDKSAWAKVTYGDGSVDFVNIPLNITDNNVPAVPSTKTDADQNDPQGQNVTTTVGTVPSAKDGVQWPSGQPEDVNGNPITLPDSAYTWAGGNPDVSKAGVVPAIVNITYPDGSQDQVAVNVIVKDASGNVPTTDPTKDNGKYDPEGKEVSTTIGTPVDPSTTITWPNGAPTDGTPTYEWSTEPDIWSQGQHPGVVKVTYHDGTSDLVPVTVDVTNAPSGKNTTVPQNGTLPVPSTVITWTDPQNPSAPTPSGATYAWTTSPDTTTPGAKTGVVTITYHNGEKTQVPVPVTVTPTVTTGSYDPYVDPQNYPYDPTGATLAVPTVNLPSGETAPTNVHYDWGTKPDTKKGNSTQTATVVATYPDPADPTKTITKTIPVIVHIGSMADHYAPTATDLTVPHNANMSNYPASTQISGVPSDVVSYDAWAPMPVTEVSGTQPTMIKVTYTDGSFDYVPLNVHVYSPEYAETSVAQGGTQTVTPTWTADKDGQEVSFAGTTGTPSWATVDRDGTVTLKPGTDVNAGGYAIPVQVTYNNGSTETVYVPVMVTGDGHEDNNVWTVNGDTVRSFSINTFDTHKTNDGSANAMANVNAPQIGTISFAKEAYNKQTHQYKDVAKITYKLNDDKTEYVVDSILLNGQTISNPTLTQVQQVKNDALLHFAATDVTTSWMPATDQWAEGKDRTPNTDASNFDTKGDGTPGSGTKTSTAQSQYGDPNGDQRSTESQLSGNSRARANIELTGDAQNIFGVAHEGWINVFGNFYGAETNQTLTFKQNQDISNLTQDQYRQLINVTDLGAAGWNGTNDNPNAPQVLAYLPGTDTTKTFWMSWAPNGQPSTATVANGVSGSVRIHFNDGTWLDIPATINVVADPDSGKPDQDKSEYTQKIVYTYNGNEVATTNIDNIAKGSDVSAATLKSTIDANVPNNYSIEARYRYPAGLTNVTATPTTIYVPLTLKSGENFSDTGKIVYQTADGTHIADGSTIKSNDGDILTAALLKDLANQKVPAGYHITGYPASYTVTGDGFTIPVIVAKDEPSTPVVPTPTQGQVTITYVEKGNPSHILGTASVTGNNGDSVAVANTINGNVPAHWKIDPSFTVPATETVPGSVIVPLVHATTPVTPGQPGVTPDNPDYANLFHKVTRTINVENPVTHNTDTTDETVEFGRTGVKDEVTGKFIDGEFGDWYVYNTADNALTNETTGTWNEFDAPEFSGYTPSQAVVEAKTVNAETPDETVTITYTKSDNGDHGNGGNTNPTPTPGDNGDHNNGENGNHGNQGNGNGNGNGANLNTNNGDNGNNAHNNGTAKKALPQTGNTNNAAAVAGLGLAGLTAMLGLAGTMKRKHN